MGYKIGMTSMKLCRLSGKGGRHCGNFHKVAAEALQERCGHDPDINHAQTPNNFYEGVKTAAELEALSEQWIANYNAQAEKNNQKISDYIRQINLQRKAANTHCISLQEALSVINKTRAAQRLPPLMIQKKIRRDAVVMCATLIKPPQAFMASLTPAQQKQFLLDALAKFKEIVGADNVKAAVIHFDELVPHMHIFWQSITADGRLCAKEMHNLQFLGKLNREMPQYLREHGWPEIDDCDSYDTETAQKVREQMGEAVYRAYNLSCRKERLEQGKKSGRSSKQFKADMDKAVAEAQLRLEQIEAAAEAAERRCKEAEQLANQAIANQVRLQDEIAALEAQSEKEQDRLNRILAKIKVAEDRQRKLTELSMSSMQQHFKSRADPAASLSVRKSKDDDAFI